MGQNNPPKLKLCRPDENFYENCHANLYLKKISSSSLQKKIINSKKNIHNFSTKQKYFPSNYSNQNNNDNTTQMTTKTTVDNISLTENYSLKIKYQKTLFKNNNSKGINGIFELYKSTIDNEYYLAYSNKDIYSIDIIHLKNLKKINSLKIFTDVTCIKYCNNKKNIQIQYLLSADLLFSVIVWDISNNYNKKFEINTEYENYIYNCLIFFDEYDHFCNCINYYDYNYIIISTYHNSIASTDDCIKVYSLIDGEFIRNIPGTNKYLSLYMLLWYNEKNKQNYIIDFCNKCITVNNLIKDECYAVFQEGSASSYKDEYISGFIYYQNNKNYLFAATKNGMINIFELFNKIQVNSIKNEGCNFFNMLQINENYAIISDKSNVIKILGLKEKKIIQEEIIYDKIKYNIYGLKYLDDVNILLASGDDGSIIKLNITL